MHARGVAELVQGGGRDYPARLSLAYLIHVRQLLVRHAATKCSVDDRKRRQIQSSTPPKPKDAASRHYDPALLSTRPDTSSTFIEAEELICLDAQKTRGPCIGVTSSSQRIAQPK
jgi:hypothetical protein